MLPGSLPPSVRSSADVVAILPPELRAESDAPVREALAGALFELLVAADNAADFAAAQSDPLRAIEADEDALFEERGTPRARGEEDEDYRDRALSVPQVATFTAIRDAVNTILATVTTKTCRISERALDCWFIGSGSTDVHAFLERTPEYTDRLYDFLEGTGVTGNDPGGIRVFDGQAGRHFLLRVPDLTGSRDNKITVFDSTNPVDHPSRFFLGLGAAPAFVSGSGYDVTVYDAIVTKVTALVGHSVTWTMIADSKLS